MEPLVTGRSNWVRTGGSEFDEAIKTRLSQDDIYIKPELDDLLKEEHAILLSRPHENEGACELQLSVVPRYKVEAITLIASAAKVELFLGKPPEYTETVYGEIIVEDQDEDEVPDEIIEGIATRKDEEDTPLISYRYDIEVERSGIVELTLKLLATPYPELCLYSILLTLAPNPNGCTSLLRNPTINLENVQQMLGNQKLSPNAEKCKLLMQMCSGAGAANANAHSSALLPQIQEAFNKLSTCNSVAIGVDDTKSNTASSELDKDIKAHIDVRLQELETKLTARLDAFEAQQNWKLDKVLKMLEDSSSLS